MPMNGLFEATSMGFPASRAEDILARAIASGLLRPPTARAQPMSGAPQPPASSSNGTGILELVNAQVRSARRAKRREAVAADDGARIAQLQAARRSITGFQSDAQRARALARVKDSDSHRMHQFRAGVVDRVVLGLPFKPAA